MISGIQGCLIPVSRSNNHIFNNVPIITRTYSKHANSEICVVSVCQMPLDFNPQGFFMPAEGSGVKEEQDGVHEIPPPPKPKVPGAREGCCIGLSISGC